MCTFRGQPLLTRPYNMALKAAHWLYSGNPQIRRYQKLFEFLNFNKSLATTITNKLNTTPSKLPFAISTMDQMRIFTDTKSYGTMGEGIRKNRKRRGARKIFLHTKTKGDTRVTTISEREVSPSSADTMV